MSVFDPAAEADKIDALLSQAPPAPVEQIQQAAQELQPPVEEPPKRRGRKPGSKNKKGVVVIVTTPEENEFWGKQLQNVLKQTARARKWPKPPKDIGAMAGQAAAQCANKYLGGAAEHPEAMLLLTLTPYLLSCLRVEYATYQRNRAATGPATGRGLYPAQPGANRGPNSDLRPERQRQNPLGEEYYTTPFTPLDRGPSS